MAIVSRAQPGEPLSTDVAKTTKQKCEVPPFSHKLAYAVHMYSLQTVLAVPLWVRDWREYFYPARDRPNIVKTYECRPTLPIRWVCLGVNGQWAHKWKYR